MEDRKVTFFSSLASVFIHAVIFSIPVFSGVIFSKTYKLVETVPLTFDTAVDANLIGERAVKGSKEESSPSDKSFVPDGKSSKKATKFNAKVSSNQNKGNDNNRFSDRGIVLSNRFVEVRKEQGNGKLSLVFSNNAKKNGKEKVPAVKMSRVVPYLLRVRDKILSNWQPPYTEEKSKEIVTIYLTIASNGKVEEINVEKLSSSVPFNRSAITAIYDSEPFPPFPKSMKGISEVRVKVNFENR
ncbi:protein TonB [Desulfurobacterium pacificum]|uniref:Protein TonB n=1 Tax=Desulfurobacterium pacificum TaxID=240166 RepID=A0ABY1NIF6_9BACT|nr:TonB family protein [Desulfurobacterium pacificum]SMP10649.1 protein TonB [Desulfurobacterium pacificum]